ncbi:hypothetical protein C4577_02300 [Candidatus Parcubacteria bacterium]|nr:MAG: hypothetical protein C4577_02300 [Candidatus Parcubacteria bacterium]
MGVLEEIFSERLELPDGIGHADVLISDRDITNPDIVNKSLPNSDQKSPAAPKTYYTSGVHHTHPPPPYATVDGKPDKLNRKRCFVSGQITPCQVMPKRGLSGAASPKHIKSLRKKYGKGSTHHQ